MGKLIEQGIVVSIGNQKGGVGKSVITSLAANYIHQEWGQKIKIVVVDSDDLQATLYNLRKKEEESDSHYRLLRISSEDLPSQIETLIDEFDIIFVDLPGNLKQPGVLQCYNLVDVLICPTQPTVMDLQSTFDFVKMYQEKIVPTREKHGLSTTIRGLFSRVDAQIVEFKELNLKETRDQLPFPFLENYVPESKVAFQRNVSTVDTYKSKKNDNYEALCEEILSTITSIRQ